MPDDIDANNRVSTRQFYDALLKQNDRMDNMERRILDKLDVLPALAKQAEHNADEIKLLRSRSNTWDALNSLGLLIGSILGISLGPRQ